MENLLVSNCTLGCIFELTMTHIFGSFLLSGRHVYNLVPRVLSYPSLRSERELGTRLGASIVAKERSSLFTLDLACKMGGYPKGKVICATDRGVFRVFFLCRCPD